MFRVEMIGDSGSYEARAVQVAGAHSGKIDGHSGEIDSRGAIYHADLSELPLRWRDFWSDDLISQPLLDRVIREAIDSDLLTGRSPEEYSPLGKLDLASFGRWAENERAFGPAKENNRRAASDTSPIEDVKFELGSMISGTNSRIIAARRASETIAAMAYCVDSFIVPVPIGTSSIEVRYLASRLTEEKELEEIHAKLGGLIDDEPIQCVLVWRLYLGSNTTVTDGATPAESGRHKIFTRITRQAGFLVGRLVRSVSKLIDRDSKDWTANRRRNELERGDRTTAENCMDIRTVDNKAITDAVIAVHGTMSCAMLLAKACHQKARDGILVLRFEHDTWLPIHHNANELANEIERVGCRRLLLVAHSRGGLVARHAADVLATRGVHDIHIVSLGTPYLGTPLIDAVNVGLLGTKVLLGVLRALGGTIVDVTTRLAGLMIKTQLPRGIEAMYADSTYLSGFSFRTLERTVTLSGAVDPDGTSDNYGLSLGSLGAGFALPTFDREPNDLVVAASSSSGGLENPINVACDHFSYPEQKEFDDAINKYSEFLHETPLPVRRRPGPDNEPEWALD